MKAGFPHSLRGRIDCTLPPSGPRRSRSAARSVMPRHIIRRPTIRTKAILALAALTAAIPVAAWNVSRPLEREGRPCGVGRMRRTQRTTPSKRAGAPTSPPCRPSGQAIAFWQHVFTTPDGSIAFGSAVDGRLLATFPARGVWTRHAVWVDPAIARVLDGQRLAPKLRERREQVALLLESAAGPVLHNSTRGDALLTERRQVRPFPRGVGGAFTSGSACLREIGLAQVIFESGLNGTRRSEANAVGFCQWLQRNWRRLNYFSPTPIEGRNQTTQAPYCAAYLSVLATRYGLFIPALSEHNAGGTNVGRALINGEYLGAEDVRARYFLGSQLARDLRALPGKEYADVYKSYGPRSYLYAEMVFGNTFNIRRLIESTPQMSISAMRTPRPISLADILSERVYLLTRCADSIRHSSSESRATPYSTFRTTSASLVLTSRSGAGRPALRM